MNISICEKQTFKKYLVFTSSFEVNKTADLPWNFCKLSKGFEMVPDSVSVYLVWLASQLKQCILQPWTFIIPAPPVNKNKLPWVLDQSQSFNDFSQWCSKQSRPSLCWVLGKCSFNDKPLVNLQAKHTYL